MRPYRTWSEFRHPFPVSKRTKQGRGRGLGFISMLILNLNDSALNVIDPHPAVHMAMVIANLKFLVFCGTNTRNKMRKHRTLDLAEDHVTLLDVVF